MRVLLTSDTVGGVWTYAIELADALHALGDDILIATMGGSPDRNRRRDIRLRPWLDVRISTYRLEWMRDPWADVSDAGRWLLDIAERWRPDIIHLNDYAHGALPWPAATVVVGHSCVYSWWRAVHGGEAPAEWLRYRHAVRAGMERAGAVVAPTRFMLRELDHFYGPLAHASIVPNGIDPRGWLESPLGSNKKDPVVLCVGRLWDEAKNVQSLIAAAESLPCEVLVAGDAQHPDGGTVSLPGVRMLGALAREQVAYHMHRAAIYAFPARYEPFGLSVLEAATAGCALVLGDISPLRETWDGVASFVDPSDAAALRVALAELLNDPVRCRERGRAARARALRFSSVRMARQYRGLYTDVLRRADDAHEVRRTA